MQTGLDHYQKHTEEKPSKRHHDFYADLLDHGVYAFGALSLAMTVPQIWKIFAEKTAAGISMASWIAYLASAVFWIFYAKEHRSRPILVVNAIWVVLDVVILTGIFIYG